MTSEAKKQANRENGKKGGRPVSDTTLRTQLAREYISKQLQDSLAPITAKAITQAMEGNSDARNWLSERAWGKATQPISGPLEEPLFENEHYEQARTIIATYLANAGEGDEN